MTDQPEALRLADALDCRGHRAPEWQDQLDAASELRRLHGEVDRLREALESMTAEFDSGDVNDGEWAAIQKARAALKEPK